jgi:hypothetical protein
MTQTRLDLIFFSKKDSKNRAPCTDESWVDESTSKQMEKGTYDYPIMLSHPKATQVHQLTFEQS